MSHMSKENGFCDDCGSPRDRDGKCPLCGNCTCSKCGMDLQADGTCVGGCDD